MAEFFLELVSEEIPPAQQEIAERSLERLLLDAFRKEGVTAKTRATFSTPLRFGICLDEVPTTLPARNEERRGPPESAPAKAVEGFTRTCGEGAKIEVRDGYYFALITTPETTMRERLMALLPELLRAFPWQKSMRWLEGDDFRWVRPLREITCLLDGEALHFQVAQRRAGNKKGVRNFAEYEEIMREKNIFIDPQERGEQIKKQISQQLEGGEDHGYYDLKKFITLTEMPIIRRYTKTDSRIFTQEEKDWNMSIPPYQVEQIILEKEFHMLVLIEGQPEGSYLILLDGKKEKKNEGGIIKNFEKVLEARTNDATFFFKQDMETGMESLRQKLSGFIFYHQLGTMLDKAERIETLCKKYNDPNLQTVARYCKADIASQTGKEFPEALGDIGAVLFCLEKESPESLDPMFRDIPLEILERPRAIRTHYQPIGAKDSLPSKEGQLLGLADRADTLVGFFSINELPTGSKDPFALRRAAIGMIRIILESPSTDNGNDFSQLNLNDLFTQALQAYGKQDKAVLDKLRLFITERLKYHLRQDFAPDLVDAAIKDTDLNLKRIEARVKALHAFLKSDNGKALMAAWRRISGILKNNASSAKLNHDLLKEKAEINLAQQLNLPAYAQALEAHDFNQAFTILANLRQNFDTFFDEVRVETDDKTLTQNRLALCSAAQEMMRQAADFSKIQT